VVISFRQIEAEKRWKIAFSNEKFKIELYPDELTDIYKFAVDKNLFLKYDYDYLKEKKCRFRNVSRLFILLLQQLHKRGRVK